MSTWTTIAIFVLLIVASCGNDVPKDDKSKNLPKKMLARRREEHLSILKMIAQNPKYEHRFQLIQIGATKAFDLINEQKSQIEGKNKEQAKMIVLENSCLLMDFIVNFNEDIYVIFNKITKADQRKNWKEMLKYSVDLLERNEELLDEITSKEFAFVKDNLLKIFNEELISDYTYENSVRTLLEITKKSNQEDESMLKEKPQKKAKKKLKRGPGLQGNIEL